MSPSAASGAHTFPPAGRPARSWVLAGSDSLAPPARRGRDWRQRTLILVVTVLVALVIFPAARALAADGQISGVVTDASTHQAVPGTGVVAYNSLGVSVGYASTDADGDYTIAGLNPATYTVEFAPGSGANYLPQYYSAQTTASAANQVSVTSGQTTQSVNAALAAGGEISGTVTAASGGTPEAGIYVEAYTSAGGFAGSATTDVSGHYTIVGLPTGSYDLQFSAGSGQAYAAQWYNASATQSGATNVAVTVGMLTPGINAAMQAYGAISGTVTDASSHVGLAEIEVDVYAADGTDIATAFTNADGTYSVGGLPAGSYKVEFSNPGGGNAGDYEPQYYSGQATLGAAAAVVVTTGATTTNINAALGAGGNIAGTVTDASTHAALANIEVDAYDTNGDLIATTATGSNGTYVLTNLATASYRVGFVDDLGSGLYLPTFYNGSSTLASATAVAVSAGATSGSISAGLTLGGQITGTVKDAGSGLATANVAVAAYDGSGTIVASTFTAADGTYTLSQLVSGNYRVGFAGPGIGPPLAYVPQFYSAQATLAGATPISVVTGETTANIGATITGGGEISGTVTDSISNKPIAGAEVAIDGQGVYLTTTTNAAGQYLQGGLPPGSYTVYFDPPSGSAVYLFDSGPPLSVQAATGQDTSGVNGELVAGAQITGVVTDATTHAALAGVEVSVLGSGGGTVVAAVTNSSGQYDAGPVATGTYSVKFAGPAADGYAPQFYNAQPSGSTATLVSATDGQTTSSINAALATGGKLTGTVTDASSHASISGATIDVYDTNFNLVGSATTGPGGSYTVGGLATGSYTVYFSDANSYLAQYYAGTADARTQRLSR